MLKIYDMLAHTATLYVTNNSSHIVPFDANLRYPDHTADPNYTQKFNKH